MDQQQIKSLVNTKNKVIYLIYVDRKKNKTQTTIKEQLLFCTQTQLRT